MKNILKLILTFSLIACYNIKLQAQTKPSEIAGLVAWFSADSIKQEDGTEVPLWINLANELESVTQTLTENCPKLVSSVPELNNKPVLRFDGNDYLDGGNILNIGTKGQTVIFVGKTTKANGSFYAKSLYGTANYRYYFIYDNNKPSYYCIPRTQYGLTSTAKIDEYDLISTLTDFSGEIMLFQENQGIKSNTMYNYSKFSSSFNFLIGAYNNNLGTIPPAATLYLNGDIAEMIFYNRPLSKLERQSVENYLRMKYFPGTERLQFSIGNDIVEPYSLKPVTLSIPDTSYFKTYIWNSSDLTKSITVTSSNYYTVKVEDDWGYEYFDTVYVTLPDINQIWDQTICNGDTLEWDCELSGAYSYLWSTGETTQSIKITKAGNYFVTVTDTLGYSKTSKTATIAIDTFSTAAKLGNDTTLCSGNTIGLATCQNSAISYLWSTGETSSTINIQTSGEYTILAKNIRGCSAIDTIQISINGKAPIVEFVTTDICQNSTTNILSNSYTVDNTAITETTWMILDDTLQGENITYNFPSFGTYQFSMEVKTEVGCIGTLNSSITIHPTPQVNFSPENICQYTAAEISSTTTISTGSIISYSWVTPNFTSTNSEISFLSDTAGKYPISLTAVSNEGCTNTITKNINVRQSSKIEFVHTKTCLNDTVVFFDISEYPVYNEILDGYWKFDNYTIEQYSKSMSIQIKDTLQHTVELFVKTFNGCTNIGYDTIQMKNIPKFSIPDYIWTCKDEGVQLSAILQNKDSIKKYIWDINGEEYTSKNPIVEFAEAGSYNMELTLESEHGCSNSSYGNIIVEESPVANFSFYPTFGAAPLEVTFTNLSEDADYYKWIFELSDTSMNIEPTYTFTDKNNSYVKLIAYSEHGCSDSIITAIPIQLADQRIKITDVKASLDADGYINYTIQILNTGNFSIPLLDLSISSPTFNSISERWTGYLKSNNVLDYTFTAKTIALDKKIPDYVCATANIVAEDKYKIYYTDSYCKDNLQEFKLYKLAPNPVEKTTTLTFNLKESGTVILNCIDATGKNRLSKSMVLSSGLHSLSIDMTNLASGRYLFQLIQGNYEETIQCLKK